MISTFKISSRRYLGNKYKLLGWIKNIVDENCTDINSFFDVFSGTGSVASAFIKKLKSYYAIIIPTMRQVKRTTFQKILAKHILIALRAKKLVLLEKM